ncbi:MAG: hypothetical protein AAFN92_13070 [Bacteroidota bacterium]
MSLRKLTYVILLMVLLLMVGAGIFPSPLTIALAVGGTSVLVLLQVYAVLRDEDGAPTAHRRPNYAGHQRK